ncbi:MAG: DUF433 domain-containing protein [Nitrospira sp.]|nr:DUF433 domain-containing protein [Nitrospira sp.]
MATINWKDYVVPDPAMLTGKPTLKGTHLSVDFVLDLLAAGSDQPSLKANYPNLTEDRIRAR